ncbi:hypothetical protein EGT07_26855 [Herbaspirillum sp. HC18]|nr:hypothetical protein EGT07_26855 [Herbaspirillum sp. HC18]
MPVNVQVPYSFAHRVHVVLGAGEGAGAGAAVMVAYSQILLAPGYGSPNTVLLQAMEPVAVLVAHLSFRP